MKNVYLKYIMALLLFGTNGIIAGYIDLSSYETVLFRTLIGSLFLFVVFMFSPKTANCKKSKKDVVYLLASGIAMGISWMFLYEAYAQIGVGVATLAYYCGPVIVMLLAYFVFCEKITIAKSIGFVVVLAGMYLVNRQEIAHSGFSWGLLCGVMSAVMYAVMVICNKKASGITGLENSMLQLVFGFAAVMVFTLIKQGVSFTIPVQSILPVLFLGIVNTGIGCYLYFSAIPRLPAQTVAICGYLEPVSALIFSAAFLSERLTFVQLFGTILVLCGAAFSELCKFSKNK